MTLLNSVDMGKPKMTDVKDYISNLKLLSDTINHRTSATQVVTLTHKPSLDITHGYHENLNYVKDSQDQDMRNTVAVLKDLENENNRLAKVSEIKNKQIRDMTSAMATSKNKLTEMINENDSDILQKSDLLEELIGELETTMKARKALALSLHRLNSDILTTEMANTYLDIERQINKYTNMSVEEKQRIEISAKKQILETLVNQSITLTKSVKNIEDQVKEARRLRNATDINIKALDNPDLSRLQEEFKASLKKKYDDEHFLNEKIKNAKEELQFLEDVDSGMTLDDIQYEISSHKETRANLLEQLKAKVITDIRLNRHIFDKTKEARHHEGMLELASVDEDIMERNHLMNVLQQTYEYIDDISANDPTDKIIQNKAILLEKDVKIKELQERHIYIVSKNVITCLR